ncbi:serine-rich adhesin for platelets isoform X2 [Drosophila subobscura]|uniref:serine-rich adhesin for platelets isoform X2 n=1 Tax=Drosophila subobscura TaxID=7241 RepID=UPI00155A8012|nr:serine-rich adhesin for platelets isoform X2 [Drosophila subobscura]
MQQQDDPPSLPVGTEVSAKYKGAFCEAKVSKVVRNIKVKVVYKQGLGTGIVPDDAIKAPPGQMRVGAVVEVRHPDRKEIVEATIAKIQDGSQYTVVFDDGDITTLRRTALCLKSGRHFNESETLDQLPLTHPEHFGNPVVGGRRGRRRGQLNEDSSDDDDESDAKEVVNEKEENIGQVVCVETESKKKDKEKWFPALVVAPTAQATVRIRVKDEYLVRSFKDGRYYTVPKKEATEFTREVASKQDVPAVQAALEFLDSSILPPHWDRDSLFGLSNLTSDDDGEIDSDSSDDEPHEEKDRFVAQLYKYMDDRGTPLNKVPSIQSRDVDLYRLFRAVQKRGGYNRVTTQNQWKMIAVRLGFAPCTVSVMNLVKQAYKKFLQPYGDFHRKLGCSMLMTSRNTNRSKGRSLVRANSVASPKPMETTKTETISKLAQPNQTAHSTSSTSSANASAAAAAAASSAATSSSSIGPTLSAAASAARAASTASISTAEESENTSESSVVVEPIKKQRKASAAASTQQQGKVKSLVEKYEEKSSPATPQATASAAPTAATAATPGATIETMQSTITAAATSAASHTPSTATPALAATTSAAATATATPSAAVGKDTESDMPLAKIKLQAAAAAAAAVTRNSMEKDQQQTNISPGSATSSKANSADNQRSRDASPASAAAGPSAAPPTTVKKEKHQRKQVEKTDEKQRGKRKKEDKDISVEKIDTGDFVVGIGDKLKVNYHEKKSPSSHGSTYEAKVIEISVQRGVPMYLVHYTGWNNRYDEWVPRERIAENLTKGSKQKTRTISTSSANSGSGGGGGGGGGGGAGSGTLPPGPGGGGGGGDKQPQPGKDGPSKTVPPSGAPGGQQIGQSGNPSGFSMASSLIQGMVKTPTTTGAKRGRGRSDSMPPRSTTPSSVASNSSRTKSPASSQQQLQQQQPMKKRPTRGPTNSANIHRISDASLASESDSDSDEPVRRPKRQSAKEKAAGKPQATAKGRLSRAPSSGPTAAAAQQSPTDDSDEDEEEEEEEGPGHTPSKQQQQQQQQAPPSLQRSRAAGNRAMSSGAATSKGRDYDLSEIRSELKGFQPQLLSSSAASSSALPSAERKNHSKGEGHAPVGDIKKEPKMESSAKSSSTELSSETDSYVDEDSQSSDYRKQASEKRTKAGAAGQTAGKAGNEPTGSGDSMQLLESIKTEAKDMIKAKPFHTGADIKPTTTLIAPARFGLSSSSSQSAAASSSSSTSTQGPCLSAVAVAKYTSVIVEKPLTMTTAAGASSKKDPPHASKKVDSLKKQSNTAGGGATATATSGQEAKKFAEPVSTLKVELPAACSPSSSSSSSSSFCSSASGGSSSSATRSLPDMSKLAISGGAGTGATAAAAAGPSGTQPSTPPTAASTASKESKYSSSCLAAATGGPLTLGDLLASDVYEFKDTEPFEFEKRISPMAATCSTTATGVAGVAGLPAAASTVITAVPSQPVPAAGAAAAAAGGAGAAAAGGGGTSPTAGTPLVLVSSAARKQALKATAMQHSLEQHQLPSTVHGAAAGAAAAGAGAGAGAAPPTVALAAGKAKKRGSPLKEASLVLEKPKLIKLEKEQTEQKPSMPQQHQQQQQTPPTVKVVAATPNLAQKLNTPPGVGAAGAGSSANVGQLTPGHHATPFDALRKSPSFNLNIMALNEELAQTVQETTRALTDALQPPTTPISASVPAAGPLLICPVTPPTGAGSQAAASPKLSTPPQPQTKPPPPANVVGSPFIETRNVFELSTSNEGSGYSSGESKDNKLEKLENVKILLAGAAGLPFDLDAVKYEQKTSSIADKVLKAISQKKEEVENNKSKPQPLPLPQPHTEATGTGAGTTTGAAIMPKLQLSDMDGSTPLLLAKPEPCTSSKLEALKMLSEPLKIQTGSLLGELYRPGPATNSPETKSILDSMPAKNNELSETIQKLECAIQQRKTPVGGLSLASSTAGTPPTAHTPNSTVTVGVGGGFSDESMDSTDSEQRLVIEDVIVEDHTTTTTAEQKSPGSQEELAETMDRTISTPTPPVKLELMGSKQLSSSGIQAPIALKLAQAQAETSTGPGCSSFAGKLAAVTQPPPLAKLQQQQQQQHQPPEESKMGSSFGIPIVLPEIPATVVMATPSIMIPAFTIPMEQDQDSPPIMACTSSPASPSPPTVSPELGDRLGSGLLLKTYIEPEAETRSSYHQQQQQTEIVLQSNVNVSSSSGWMGRGAEIAGDTAPVVARPFVMHAVNKEMYNVVANTAAPAASSPLINDPHNESINLLCEETIPGSPAPTYGGKDEQMPATGSSALVIAGITPLSPDTPPPGAIGLLQGTTGAQQNVGESAMGASPANSSPDSASQEDESSEETKTKHLENELEGLGLGGTLRKRKRTSKQTQAQISAVAAQLQSLSKRRRQVSGMRSSKTTATVTAGSDTDENSDHLVSNLGQQPAQQQQQLRHSGRQQLLPLSNTQQQQQQQQPQQQQQQPQLSQQLQQPMQQQTQQSSSSTQLGVRPCPYNFLVELDRSLSSDQCITILRKQIQDLRKAYNTIKGELAAIDRRRKKMRRREREKKQQQQQGQTQGKVCT